MSSVAARATGSSPLARGLRSRRPGGCSRGRIIPARAGFTCGMRRTPPNTADHPRSRGVYEELPLGMIVEWGSSPLARGLPALGPLQTRFARIIPARAGFTAAALPNRNATRDHPRSRGVYRSARPVPSSGRGSSPLARGLPTKAAREELDTRIIPARAGFTRSWIRRRAPPRDHPRSRGVYICSGPSNLFWNGSSPLARGLRPIPARPGTPPGIIPARAGFTPAGYMLLCQEEDHPRSRGVYCLTRSLSTPPCWIIPARAGFTRRASARSPAAPDHPRSRGVYLLDRVRYGAEPGSSPLARGLQLIGTASADPHRIIPARAGFTPDDEEPA